MPDQDLLGAHSSTYANVFSFLGLPLSRDLQEDVDAVVMGVPFDLATSARAGARSGPTAIRQAAAQLRWEKQRWPWRFALSEALSVIDYGDIDFSDGDSADMVEAVQDHAGRIVAAGKALLSLGGDHFVSLPLLRAVSEHHGQVALIHFDAHTDTEETELEYYHGSMFYRALQEGLFDPERSIQVGIRTEYDFERHELGVLDATWVNAHDAAAVSARILDRVGGGPAYLSIDIDCLDPAFAPGTGTPVAGGMSTAQLMQILRGLVPCPIIAADIMEVAPAYDSSEVTALAAATCALDLLYLFAEQRRQD